MQEDVSGIRYHTLCTDYFYHSMDITLRFIQDPARPASFNMAADRYLLSQCSEKPLVVVRFYSWVKPTITIGVAQKAEDILALDAMEKSGVVWIRRPTGGRAVFHCEDITYTCAFSKSIAMMGQDIAATYHLIARCLMSGLQRAGIESLPHSFFIDAHDVNREIKLPCFLAPNRSEIMVHGKKLVGSAQKRNAEAVMQHGSIPLTGRFRELPLFQKGSLAQQKIFIKLLSSRCVSVSDCLPRY